MSSFDGDEIKSNAENLVDNLKWVPLSIVLVEYPQGDIIGKFLALISLMPFAIIAGFVALILFRRDLHTIAFFGGVLVNEVVNLILKNIICETRPVKRDVIYTEYGMPSSHSQFMWFFTTYVILFAFIRVHYSSNSTILERFWRLIMVFPCIALAVTVGYSRIYLQYHSNAQVLCGALVGMAFGIIWFIIVHFVLSSYFPVIVSWKTSEHLLLRDTTLIPNVLWFEYTNIRSETRARSRKLVSMKSQ